MEERGIPARPLEDRLREALGARAKRVWHDPSQRAAAVLLLVFERAAGPWIVLTRRTETVRHHKGEISFPGGMRDPGDPDLAATALRETHEELGLDPSHVRIVGELDDLPTFVTGYLVSPYVALISEGHDWNPSPAEIAEVLELPLHELARVARSEVWKRDELEIPMHVFELDGHFIWGLTARILRQFLDVAGEALGL